MLKEQRSGSIGLTKPAEFRAAIASQNSLQDLIDKKEKSLADITTKKVKLLEAKISKKK